MNNFKKIFISTAVILSATSVSLIAKDVSSKDSLTTKHLEMIKVSASRIPSDLAKSARMMVILDSSTIKSLPVKTVNELLKYVSGVDVRQRGAYGSQTDISVRGGTHDQIAILINGINLSDPHTGHNAFSIPVDLNDIARIEILEGPAARVYGISSMAGAINIITKGYGYNDGSIRGEYGSYNYGNLAGRLSYTHNKFYGSVSSSYLRTDGYSKVAETDQLNTDIRQVSVFGQTGYHSDLFKLDAQAGYINKNFGASTFYSPKFDNQFENVAKVFASVSAQTDGFIHFNPSVFWNMNWDRFELFRGQPNKFPYNYHNTIVYGANLNSWFETILGKTAFGVELRNEDFISSKLGEPLKYKLPVRGADAKYAYGKQRLQVALFAEQNIDFKNFNLSFGLTAIKNTADKAKMRVFPSLDFAYQATNHLRFYLSVNTAYRMPTFTELYYNLPPYKPNKDLMAETMLTYEFGTKYSFDGFSMSLSLFDQKASNLIDWISNKNDSEHIWSAVQHKGIRTYGTEVNLMLQPNKVFGLSWWKSINIGYTYLYQRKALNKDLISRYALEYLRNKFVATTVFSVKNFDLSLAYSLNDRIGSYSIFENKVSTGKTSKYKPYSLLDARLSYSVNNFVFYGEFNNILNQKYLDYGGVPQPGFICRVGCIFNFNL